MRQQHRGWWIALVVLGLIVLVVPVLGGGMMGAGMMGWHGDSAARGAGGWGWGLAMALGALAMFAFWGAVIAAIVLAVRAFTASGGGGVAAREDVALDILKRRYAAGELTRQQYEEMCRVLERNLAGVDQRGGI